MHEKQLDSFCDMAEKILNQEIRCVMEIGARDCQETLAFSERFPAADIYAFECNPQTLPLCREKVRGKEKIRLIEKAVSDKSGALSFYQIDTEKTKTDFPGGNPGASSLLQSSGKYPLEQYAQKKISVESVTLRDFFGKNGIKEVDLLWMDIQGGELMALKGAGEDIRRIRMIHLEVEFFEIYSGQPLFAEIKSFLNAKGFAFQAFTHIGSYSGDAVFIRRDISRRSRIAENISVSAILVARRIRQSLGALKRRLIAQKP